MRKNLLRIEAMVIAVIMTISMFGNVNVNAAEIQNESKTVTDISILADELSTYEESDGLTYGADVFVENEKVEEALLMASGEAENGLVEIDDAEIETEVKQEDYASEEFLMYVDEPEYIFQAGGFTAHEEALGVNASSASQYIYERIKARQSEIDITSLGMTHEQAKAFVPVVLNNHPDLYFVYPSYGVGSYGGRMYIYIKFTDEETDIVYDEDAFERAVNNALSIVKPGMSDMEKAIVLHDYLALNIAYSQSIYNGSVYTYDPIFSAYGALVNQDAVCQGYALAYEYLLSLVDVECGLVTSNAICHAWNYVKIDGQYYNVDVTWDDPLFSIYGDVVGLVKHDNMFKSDGHFNRSPVNEEETHQADDWVISINGTTKTTGFANDTFYDYFYWDDVYGQFVWGDDGEVFYEYRDIIGDKIYGRSIKKGSIDGTQSEVFLTLPVKSAEAFGLYRIGDKLYYSSGLDIVGVNINDKSQKTSLYIPRNVTGTAICYNVSNDSFEVKYQSGTDRYVLSLSDVSGIEEFNVRFLDENGNVIVSRKALEGENAVAPELPEKKGYIAEWDNSFTNIQADTDIKAVYTPIDYSITYNLVKAGAVNDSENPVTYNVESAFEFKFPLLEGYEFAGWYMDAEYKTVLRDKIEKGTTEDIVLFAKWIPKKPEAPVIKAEQALVLENGDILVDADTEITIESEAGTKIYYTVDGSNPTKASKVYNGGFVVNERTVVKAIAVRETAESPVSSKIFVIANNDFKLQDDVSLKVGESSQISAVTLPITKRFSDIVIFSSSDINVATVSDSGVITAIGEGTATITATITDWRGRTLQDTLEVTVVPQTYYVTFVGFGDNVIEIQPVLGGRSAVAPDMSIENRTPDGYVFDTWDRAFDVINGDITVNASFALETYAISFENSEGAAPADISYNVTDNVSLPDSSSMAAVEGKYFAGWYDNDTFEGNPVSFIPSGSVGDRTLYAKWAAKATLTMKWDIDNAYIRDVAGKKVAFLPYSGKALTPEFTVYYGDTKLEDKKDYTYKFVNNVNAYILNENDDVTNGKKAPALVITCKGNYTGVERVYFNITRKNIEDSDVDIVPVSLAYNKKAQKVAPVATLNGKKLTTKDLIFEYNSVGTEAYIDPGVYNVKVLGKGNYEGTVNVPLEIHDVSADILIKNCKVSIASFEYNGVAIDFTDADILSHVSVTRGKEKVLYYNDPNAGGNGYDIELIGASEANDIGIYTVRVYGKGIYKGEVRATFKINGLSVSTMKIEPVLVQIYDGSEKEPVLNVTSKTGERLTLNTDYTLTYQNNVDVGTATVVINGIKKYYGSRKVTFKINQKVIAADSIDWNNIDISLLDTNNPVNPSCIEYDYVKGGVTPKLKVVYKYTDKGGYPAEKLLKEKTDYTLAYKYNTSANPVVGKEPYVVLTLKNNIKGTKNIRFDIVKKDLDDLKIQVNDIQANTQSGKYKSTPAIYDINGKKLDGKDFEAAFIYTYKDSSIQLDKFSKPEAGTIIEVTVIGKGNYKGSIKGMYRVFEKGKSISSASIKVKPEVLAKLNYNGQPVVLNGDDLEVKIGKTTVLNANYDYYIDQSSYVNNINKGTAKVTIIGKGEYAGSKTISYTIKPWYKWWIF